jgi:molybdopterin converting factor small subunit
VIVVQVTVKLFATLRTNRFNVKGFEYSPGTTILKVARDLDIPREELALTLVNGISVEVDHEIKDGDTLSLFPPVGGG